MVTLETFLKVVQAERNDDRPWMVSSPICSLLNQHRIAHCGIARTSHPDEISRMPISGSTFVACLDGQGAVQLNGMWHELGFNQACVQSTSDANQLRPTADEPWQICWIAYRESSKIVSKSSTQTCIRGAFVAEPLRHAIEGLHAETSSQRRLGIMQTWVDLIHSYVRSFVEPFQSNDRLDGMWSQVQQDLKEPWTIDRLAGIVGLSREHLRRVSLESLGRTPMQHVTFLRMRKAAGILSNTQASLAEVAEEVGYSTANAFSDVFLRVTGLRPSAFREQAKV